MSSLTSIYSLGNTMDDVDIEDLNIKQYLRPTQKSQTPKRIEVRLSAKVRQPMTQSRNLLTTLVLTNQAESDCDSKDTEEENNQHFKEKDNVDEWLNAEITKHMSMQGVENMKDALISIIKSIRQEMKDGIMKGQSKASTASVSSNEVDRADDNTPNTAPCRLPKGLSPGSFLLPFNVNSHNLYATTTLDAKDNIMP
ncbi:hypothetical protein Tco_1517396 [Tanacetum coccineum]